MHIFSELELAVSFNELPGRDSFDYDKRQQIITPVLWGQFMHAKLWMEEIRVEENITEYSGRENLDIKTQED